MSVKKQVFIFWGTMDALAVVVYCAQSVRHNRVRIRCILLQCDRKLAFWWWIRRSAAFLYSRFPVAVVALCLGMVLSEREAFREQTGALPGSFSSDLLPVLGDPFPFVVEYRGRLERLAV